MKKTILILALAFAVNFAWAGNKSGRATKVQGNVERSEALWMINDINDFCDQLTDDVKAFEEADSLSQIVWKHRDSLDKLSEETLEAFMGKLMSMDSFIPANLTATNTVAWKDAACKKVAANTKQYISFKNGVIKIYEDIFWKKQRMFDTFLTIVEYGKTPAKTPAEMVKRMLDTPEICSFIGKQHVFYINTMKGTLALFEKLNSENKKLMNVTDKELLEMFGNDHTESYSFQYNVKNIIE